MTNVAIPVDDLPEIFGDDAPIPDGYYRDAETKRLVKNGEEAPKVSRPQPPPTIEVLKSETGPKAEERAPRRPKIRGKKESEGIPLPPPDDTEKLPPYRAGIITRGMNKLYRRAGKICKVMDPDIGNALVACAMNTAEEGDPDDSVGAAWDELAKANPRVRRVLLKIIQGGVYGQLVMAHAPIMMAIVMKDAIRKHIPFAKLIEAMADKDEDSPNGNLGGLQTEDVGQMLQMMGPLLQQFGMPIPVVPETSPPNSGPVPADGAPDSAGKQSPKNGGRRSGSRNTSTRATAR